ncbi:MAG: 50S ribosomal protein L19 [Treponema sp.]|nr:50S ribosomal protein L19 [Treponema sp.]
MDIIKTIEEQQKRESALGFNIGDTVKVYFKIVEGKNERVQVYEGIVIAKNHGSTRETFTVRKESYGIGVERIFPIHSPRIIKVEIARPGKVRRAKLYYLRNAVGKAKRVKTRVGGSVSAEIAARNARVNEIVAAQEAKAKEAPKGDGAAAEK